ncbi:TBC1 domain family member 25-like [Nomascus leucogenys]|uniref:TBC1 domain family member 25-like n=1 Tax=Nomascus leucogenys TaxID=61853 RepID=UPI00122D7876|nr:TBC1 domain family member 25-like [Nomascus leucogenys]
MPSACVRSPEVRCPLILLNMRENWLDPPAKWQTLVLVATGGGPCDRHMLRPASGGGSTFEDAIDHLATASQGPGSRGCHLRQAVLDGLQQLRDNMGFRRDPLVQLPHPTALISSKSLSKPLPNSPDPLLSSFSHPDSPSSSSPPSTQEGSATANMAGSSPLVQEVGSPKNPGKSLPPTPPVGLPPPQESGRGNPFVLFLCLALLLEHRNHIMRNGLDGNELAMCFDRLVRKRHLGRACPVLG